MTFTYEKELLKKYGIYDLKMKDFEMFEICNRLLFYAGQVHDEEIKELYISTYLVLNEMLDARISKYS